MSSGTILHAQQDVMSNNQAMSIAEATRLMNELIRSDKQTRSAVRPEARNISSSSDKWEGYYLR